MAAMYRSLPFTKRSYLLAESCLRAGLQNLPVSKAKFRLGS